MTMGLERESIIPANMQDVAREKGYLPALRVGDFIFVAGQVGRDAQFNVVADPRAQFAAAFENLRGVLAEAGCTFDDIVDMTTYHVDMPVHWDAFRAVKRELFPTAVFPWTCVGATALASPAFLLEVKATACRRRG